MTLSRTNPLIGAWRCVGLAIAVGLCIRLATLIALLLAAAPSYAKDMETSVRGHRSKTECQQSFEKCNFKGAETKCTRAPSCPLPLKVR